MEWMVVACLVGLAAMLFYAVSERNRIDRLLAKSNDELFSAQMALAVIATTAETYASSLAREVLIRQGYAFPNEEMGRYQ